MVEKNSSSLNVDSIISLRRMPAYLRTSRNLKCKNAIASIGRWKADIGIHHPWVSFDTTHWRNTIVLDIDHGDGTDLWRELPQQYRPHLIIDPWSGRAAAMFILRSPVHYPNKTKTKSIYKCEQTAEIIANYFCASIIPRGVPHKNPLGLKSELQSELVRRTPQPTAPILFDYYTQSESAFVWITKKGASNHDLSELSEYFGQFRELDDTPRPRTRNNKSQEDQITDAWNVGRNDGLFTQLRLWAYSSYPECIKPGEIEAQANTINLSLADPLPTSETEAIVKSVRRFMETRYRPGHGTINRGIMKLYLINLPLQKKQQMAAQRTNTVRRDKITKKIQDTLLTWPEDLPITQKSLANQAAISLKTVKRRWKDLKGSNSVDQVIEP